MTIFVKASAISQTCSMVLLMHPVDAIIGYVLILLKDS